MIGELKQYLALRPKPFHKVRDRLDGKKKPLVPLAFIDDNFTIDRCTLNYVSKSMKKGSK